VLAKNKKTLEAGQKLTIQSLTHDRSLDCVIGEQVGEGLDAYIFSGVDSQSRAIIVKVPKTPQGELAFRLEKQVFSGNDSPHLPRIIGFQESPYGLVLALERLYPNPLQYLNRRKLRSHVKIIYDPKARYIPLPGLTALELSRELLLGIDALHKNGLVHCDVKLANLMVRLDSQDPNFTDKDYFDRIREGRYRGVLIDGGAVRSTNYLQSLNAGNEDQGVLPPQCTPVYSPPEVVLEPHTYSAGMDVYAAALIIYSYLTGHTPYSHIQRELDPTDLLSVWEFKLAENRGEISPLNFEVIQNVFYPDCNFTKGAKARTGFDHKFYSLLKGKTSSDIEERGDIQTFLAEFTELFDFKKNRVGNQHIRVAYSQGIFTPTSTLKRFSEATKYIERVAAKAAVKDSGIIPATASRRVLRDTMPAATTRAPRRPATYKLEASKLSRTASRTPLPKEPLRRKTPSRLKTDRFKKSRPPLKEGTRRIGERIEKYFRDAERGQRHFLRKHAYPIFYLEEHGPFIVSEDAPTTRIPVKLTPPSSPCIIPITAEGRPNRGISVGRADARDVQIHDSSISKLHAALAIDPKTNKWMLSDLGSTNGSSVQGHKLMPLVPALLENLYRVRFGGVKVVFFTAKSFYEYLHTMIE
jgi:serine/threonine protein kinase